MKKLYRNKLLLSVVAACMGAVFVGAMDNDAYADYTISMTSSGAQSIDVSAGGNGTAISADNITVATNCKAGYNFSMATSVSNNNLYLDGSIANDASGTYFSPVDGTSALSSTNNKNKWGYYYNSSTPTTAPNASSVFSAVPVISSPATIVSPTSSATDINDSFNIYYGVAVSSNLISGTYKMIPDTNNSNNDGTIIYYLTLAEACMPYLVQFNPTSTAGGTTLSGTGTMAAQTIPVGTPTNLNANTFTAPSGYEFDGWNTAQDGTGISYTDGQSVTDLTTGGGSITLYAQWKKTIDYMQDQTQSSLAAMMPNVGDTATLTDKRDEKDYTVAHLADGNYWMTQNLDFDIVDGGADIDSTNTDVPSNWSDAGNLTDTYATGATTWNGSDTAPESYDPGDLCWNGTVQTSSGTIANSTLACGDDKHYHIGNYYNWTAAVAMSDSSSYTTDNQDVNQSICPAGWRLPIGGTTNTDTKSFQYLVNQQSLTAGTSGNIQNSPVYFVYGGYWDGSSSYVGSYGRYWSSVVYSSNSAYLLGFDADGALAPQDTNSRLNGNSVRCVAR